MSNPALHPTPGKAAPPSAGLPTTGWKIRASLWVFLCAGTIGVGSPLIVLIVAIRARRLWWICVGVVLCICLLMAFVWLEGEKMWQSDAVTWLLMTTWLGSTAFAAGVNPQYLEIKWRRRQGLWTVQQDFGRTTQQNSPASFGPAETRTDIRTDVPASFSPAQNGNMQYASPQGTPAAPARPRAASPGTLLDVNSAGVAEFSALPGFTPDLAALAVDTRSHSGPYTSVAHFAAVLGLQPHIYARVRRRLACRPAPPAPPVFARRVDY